MEMKGRSNNQRRERQAAYLLFVSFAAWALPPLVLDSTQLAPDLMVFILREMRCVCLIYCVDITVYQGLYMKVYTRCGCFPVDSFGRKGNSQCLYTPSSTGPWRLCKNANDIIWARDPCPVSLCPSYLAYVSPS